MAMTRMKRNDRRPAAQAVLKRGKTVVDLSLASSVVFIMRLKDKREIKVQSAGVIVGATTGEVEYRWLQGDTDTPGIYFAEWEVTWGDGTTETFPSIGYEIILIMEDLA